MKTFRRISYLFVLCLFLFLLAPNFLYGNENINTVKAARINKKTVTLVQGQKTTLKVLGTSKKAKWSSNKKSVVTVSSTGKITAKKEGKAIITAKIRKKSYKCTVVVINPKLSVTSLTLQPDQKKFLKVSSYTETIQWESSDEDVADVTCKGKVIANEIGTCTIYATVNGVTLSCQVTVEIPDPECFPNKTETINGVTINSFTASYSGYIPYSDYLHDRSTVFYYPYVYNLKITGKTTPNSTINISFIGEAKGYTPLVPANNIIVSATSDSNGNFSIIEDVKFNCLSQKIYINNIRK